MKINFTFFTLILTITILSFSSCRNTPSKEELKAANVQSITQNQIILSNGKSYDIPHANNPEFKTLILTRHAEKLKDKRDPNLTQGGYQRAEKLSKILDTFAPEFVYTTSVRRCVMTAMPTAKMAKQPNVHYEPTDYYTLYDKISKDHKANRALIVGHSNTIPALLNLFVGEKRYEDMGEYEYSNLYIVQTKGFGESEILELKY